MRFFVTRRSAANFIFIIGCILMFLGVAFLLESLLDLSRVSILVSFLLLLLGTGCAVFAIKLNWRSIYLFIAALFLQAGLFLFLKTLGIISMKLSQSWPLLSIFTGIALLPSGWYKFGVVKVVYIVPAVTFIILGSVLMVFALDLVAFSLAQFIHEWWPLLIVLAGLILVLLAVSTKFTGEIKKGE